MQLLVKLEQSAPLSFRARVYESLNLDTVLEFDKLDPGLSGGVQEYLPVSKCKPKDGIIRYGGNYEPDKPWPAASVLADQLEEQRRMDRAHALLAKVGEDDGSGTDLADSEEDEEDADTFDANYMDYQANALSNVLMQSEKNGKSRGGTTSKSSSSNTLGAGKARRRRGRSDRRPGGLRCASGARGRCWG
jgi:hypothetical protein